MKKEERLSGLIAMQEKVDVAEVSLEMEKAIELACLDKSPEAIAFWASFECEGDVPTAEEFMRFCADEITRGDGSLF